VFVIEAGRARLRKIHVGKSSGTEIQVLDGLKEGQRVILYPGSQVKEERRVNPIEI
jgi:HlyD family secretion protein